MSKSKYAGFWTNPKGNFKLVEYDNGKYRIDEGSWTIRVSDIRYALQGWKKYDMRMYDGNTIRFLEN